ncbi:hypothetical protein BGZ80_000623 [Entomortierella chlamydospora]|uniref:F-box domain-containing protein n=1 Tax=Entomortierella chlamydospora TaxID=101097 RepID=A0A9P6MSU4_9FUNG|nr:hypothetical protein BGZ79_000995 [Entomortierella chlamydospora]KAG0011521.1 hypothetical protein BGZ80_000623 [Entomortierella chlamydospora]
MSPSHEQPTLLVECIENIISFLRSNHVPTLCSLLLVNKTFFKITVPILYQSPFVLVRNEKRFDEDGKPDRLILLLRLFFSELDPSLLAELPSYSIEDDDDQDVIEPRKDQDPLLQQRKSFIAESGGYFYHYRRHDHDFIAERAIPRLFGTVTKAQSQAVLAQLDKVFLKHCGSRVQSLCLASVRATQLRGCIPILTCLRRLEIHDVINMTTSGVDALVEWIKLHDDIHGTLRELRMGGVAEYGRSSEEGDMKDLVRLPQAFKTLVALDTSSWSEGWSMIDQTPLESLERLIMDYGEGQAPESKVDFLLRCRSLRILDLFVPEQDIFQGVVRLFRSLHQPAFYQPGVTSGEPLKVTPGEQVCIPPIERLYISGDHLNLRNALEDAAVGLSKSLRVLKGTSLARQDVVKPSLTWGQPFETHMPFLSELQLQGDITLEFHFSLLRCCPNLMSLKLLVNGLESCGQVDNPIEEILSLRKLQILQLHGRWPLSMTFINGIAPNLTGLKMLDLARCFGVSLHQVMKAIHNMEYLWRLGWDNEDVDDAEEAIEYWRTHAPMIRIGPIQWEEFLM